ncbi:hypothetical protein EQ845_16715 [Pseudomonas putida]|uniref:hypothetical protein n=1 Tax=Pseudomonas putida TaxID=303 RepID=UPI001179FD62|nr:hypothetical protein [Pseudomonas putida]TRO33890.1 hypothetical protein EQ845_16715 [Pseudomonas putida]
MSEYAIPLHRVMLLKHTLEHGGAITCKLHRPEATVVAHVNVENDDTTHHIKVTLGPLASSVALTRDPATKYQQLRDFLQDLANGRNETAAQSEEAIALMEAQECINGVIQTGQFAYVIATINPELPFGAVVTNDLGEVCAAATGRNKEHLAEVVRTKLRPTEEGLGECA